MLIPVILDLIALIPGPIRPFKFHQEFRGKSNILGYSDFLKDFLETS